MEADWHVTVLLVSQHRLCFRCSSGFNLGEYPAQMAVANGISLIALNTQVAEQVNSLLESIRIQVNPPFPF